MQNFDLTELYGSPLSMAEEYASSAGLELCVQPYLSKRGKAGEDARVLRARREGKNICVVVSWFSTDITAQETR